jgi:SAM-dependent methyltransferase
MLKDTKEFPGFDKFSNFLSAYIAKLRLKQEIISVLDCGGGANPMLSKKNTNLRSYDLADISMKELKKADPKKYTHFYCADLTSDISNINKKYDLVFSHMFLEHIKNPDGIHRNIAKLLKSEGIAIHLYPSHYNFPLFLNRILPECLSDLLLRIVQPHRYKDGKHLKFPAFYKRCGPPGASLEIYFAEMGFQTLEHAGFVGHDYYARFSFLALIEKRIRRILLFCKIPMISYNVLVLKKLV